MSTTILRTRPPVRPETEPAQSGPDTSDADRPAVAEHADMLRAMLARSIGQITAERDRIRRARDSIPPLQRRFNSDGHRLWLQLDDWLNGLEAALADAPAAERAPDQDPQTSRKQSP